ncbi:MAG: protein-glutamine glutaminase family protein [Pseudomonadota bacterium]|nr:protein-glutamine glutaminase family protein [Pseudomonadota bacterium]
MKVIGLFNSAVKPVFTSVSLLNRLVSTQGAARITSTLPQMSAATGQSKIGALKLSQDWTESLAQRLTFDARKNITFKNYLSELPAAMQSRELDALAPELMKDIEKDFLPDGCAARTWIINNRLSEKAVPLSCIIQSPDVGLTAGNRLFQNVSWKHHIASAVHCDDGIRILDPSVNNQKSLPLQLWLKSFQSGEKLDVSLAGRFVHPNTDDVSVEEYQRVNQAQLRVNTKQLGKMSDAINPANTQFVKPEMHWCYRVPNSSITYSFSSDQAMYMRHDDVQFSQGKLQFTKPDPYTDDGSKLTKAMFRAEDKYGDTLELDATQAAEMFKSMGVHHIEIQHLPCDLNQAHHFKIMS